jgi:hypothetical protein
MPIKFKTPTKIKNLLSQTERGLIPKVRKEFAQTYNLSRIKRTILQDMIKGVSPVQGQGKWSKYSKSYKEVIRNKAAYRRLKNGRVIRISSDSVERRFKKGKQNLVNDLNEDFRRTMRPTKRISPVNLRLSGGLHKSMFVKTVGGFLRTFRLRIGFKNKLADIHNRQGAGKSKVTRRLLPTKFGERFNRRITSFIFDSLKNATEKVAKEFTRR